MSDQLAKLEQSLQGKLKRQQKAVETTQEQIVAIQDLRAQSMKKTR